MYPRDVADSTAPHTKKSEQKQVKNTRNTSRAGSECLRTCDSNQGWKSSATLWTINGASRNIVFSQLHVELKFDNISWWMANWATRRASVFEKMSSTALATFILVNREDDLFTNFEVSKKMTSMGFGGCLSRIELEKRSTWYAFIFQVRF